MAELSFRSLTSDARVQSADGTWATALAGSSLAAENAADATIQTGYANYGTWYIQQLFLAFDTSSIPEGSTVSDVALAIVVASGTYASGMRHEVYAYDWGAAVDTTDWRTGG